MSVIEAGKKIIDTEVFYELIQSRYAAVVAANLSEDTCAVRVNSPDLIGVLCDDETYGEHIEKALETCVCVDDREHYATMRTENLISIFDSGRTHVTIDYRRKCADGQYHWIRHSIDRDITKHGQYAMLMTMLVIDSQKNTEQNLRDALAYARKAGKAKSDFLTSINHDLRTPMNAIMGLGTVLSGDLKAGDIESAGDHIKKLQDCSHYLLSLLGDILDMSRIESGQMIIERAPFSLMLLLHEVRSLVQQQCAGKNLSISFSQKNIINHRLLGDTLRLKQIVLGILSNMIQNTSEDGVISLSVEQERHKNGWLLTRLTARNTGFALSDELKCGLFEPFEGFHNSYSSYNGSLGMSIASNLTKIMNGAVTVDCRPGEDTVFVIEIPLEVDPAHSKAAPPEPKTEIEPADFSGCTFLLAEDDEINAAIATAILSSQGIEVDVAQNGELAVQMFEAAEPGRYDAVLMDVMMPVLNGYEATDRIRALARPDAREIPIIAMTANAFLEDVAAAKAHRMTAHVPKPIDVKILLETLTKYVAVKK